LQVKMKMMSLLQFLFIVLSISIVSSNICYRRYDDDEESNVAFTVWSQAPGINAVSDHVARNLGDLNGAALKNLAAWIDGCPNGDDVVLNFHRNSRAFRKLAAMAPRADAALRTLFILTCDLSFNEGAGQLFATPANGNQATLAEFDAKFHHNIGPFNKIVNSLYHTTAGAVPVLVPGVFISTPTPAGGDVTRRGLISQHFTDVGMEYMGMNGGAGHDPATLADVQALSGRIQALKVAFKTAIDLWDAGHAAVVANEPAGSVPWAWTFSSFATLLNDRYVAPVVAPVADAVLVENHKSLRKSFKRKALKN